MTDETQATELDAQRIADEIARERQLQKTQVQAAIELLNAGNTIPFIARYRKEATKGLDEVALRAIEDDFQRATELFQRKATILKSIEQQGALTPALRAQIERCNDKHALEELYLPYKPKRRTRAMVARERGLEPLAELLLKQQPLGRPKSDVLRDFVDPSRDVPDQEAALQGACDIVAEVWSEQADTRQFLWKEAGHGMIVSQVKRGKRDEESKFAAYFDHREPLRRVPSHRFLAMQRGESEGVLKVGLELPDDELLAQLKRRLVFQDRFEFRRELLATVEDAYQRLLVPAITSHVLNQLKEQADDEAIAVFAKNLRELLLAPPAGPQVTLGIDPGFRTGCKVAVVDGTGRFLENTTIYPTAPRSDTAGAAAVLDKLVQKYHVELIAIGNGTASRETDQFVAQWMRERGLKITKVVVSEAGASVYSASEIAGVEYPDLDVTV
ncbi:MAG: RNA-binding transcriptional accessory protein, partial [Planctomycetales bacterium]|nr:RNA-binding transcriptional accessory protein [Planctomycetales bacterium]